MFVLHLSWNFLKNNSGSAFSRLTVWLAIIGIFLGVMTLNVVSSVMNGFQSEMQSKLFGITEHVVVRFYEPQPLDKDKSYLQQISQVKRSAPFLFSGGILKHQSQVLPVVLLGIAPEAVNYEHLLKNSEDLQILTPGSFQILLGADLARSLYLNKNDKPFLLTAPTDGQLLSAVNLKRLQFTKAVEFKTAKRLEERLAFMHIQDLQVITGVEGKVSGYNLHLYDLYDAPIVKKQIHPHFAGRAHVSDWTEQYAELFSALRLQKTAMSALLAMIIIIALFNLTTGQVMLVNDRKSSIAVLITCGISPRQLVGIFFAQGLLIASVGIVLGTIAGYFVAGNISQWVSAIEYYFRVTLISNKVYLLDYLPSKFLISDSIFIAVGTVAMSIISCIYPAYLAQKTLPAKVLRYE